MTDLGVLLSTNEKIIATGIENPDTVFDVVYNVACEVMDLSDAQVQFAFYDPQKKLVSFPLAVEQNDGSVIDVVRFSREKQSFARVTKTKLCCNSSHGLLQLVSVSLNM